MTELKIGDKVEVVHARYYASLGNSLDYRYIDEVKDVMKKYYVVGDCLYKKNCLEHTANPGVCSVRGKIIPLTPELEIWLILQRK